MINFDIVKIQNIKENYPNWLQIFNHPYRILITGGSGSEKKKSLFNLINHQPDIDKRYLYTKDPYQVKYQFLIKKCKDVGTKHFNDSKAFIEYSKMILRLLLDTRIIWMILIKTLKNSTEILVVFDDMIADMLRNKKRNVICKCKRNVTELFIRGRKLNISLVFITQSYFVVLKTLD